MNSPYQPLHPLVDNAQSSMDLLFCLSQICKGHYSLNNMHIQGRRNRSGWSGQNRTTFSALVWVMVVYRIYRMVKIVR